MRNVTAFIMASREVELDKNNNNGRGDKDRTIYPYPCVTKSDVWQYFGFYKKREGPSTKENLDMTRAVCRVCKNTYANKGNTTNFKFHIENHHRHTSAKEASTQGPAVVQSKLSTFVNATKPVGTIFPERQSIIDDSLNKLLVGKVLPVSLVEHQLFLKFVSHLDSRYKVPSRFIIMRRLHDTKEMGQKMKEELKTVSNLATTHDSWTSVSTESYFTTTVHYITEDWVLRSGVLGTIKISGSHTAENISQELLATQQKWSLGKPIATTDNAANESKAYELLGWKRFGCYGHTINLILKNSLASSDIGRILGKTRKLVTFFHQSSSANDFLKEKQALVLDSNKVGHKLIQDVPTRWNSTYQMLARIVEQTPALMALANDTSKLSKAGQTTLKNCILSFEELNVVEGLIDILKPFEIATTIICADKVPTMQKVFPVVTKLGNNVSIRADDAPVIKDLKKKMQQELDRRSEGSDGHDFPLISCVLNPFTKDLAFMKTERKEKALKLLLEEAEGIDLSKAVKVKVEKPEDESVHPPLPQLPTMSEMSDTDDQNVESSESEDISAPKRMKEWIQSTDTDDWLLDVVCTGETKPNNEFAVKAEIERYLNHQISENDTNLSILQWWKINEMLYPRVAQIAKKYLCVPASSVSSERVFSLAGALVNKKRARLNPDNIDLSEQKHGDILVKYYM